MDLNCPITDYRMPEHLQWSGKIRKTKIFKVRNEKWNDREEPNISQAGSQLEVCSQGEYQSFVT